MTNNTGSIESLKIKLKSATALKLIREKDLCQARNRERTSSEKLATVKAANEFLKEQLEDVKNQIVQANHQISMIKICSTSEKCKIEGHVANIDRHKEGFQELFDEERGIHELRMKEIQDKEAQEQEILRLKELEIAEKKEREIKEAVIIGAECDALERECVILKKRNNAVMLKLRRKLLETENTRRELAKRIENKDSKNISSE